VALAIFLAILVGMIFGVNAAVSLMVGGMIGVVANAGYVLRAMRVSENKSPVKVFQAQAAGEGLKFFITLAGFALVFLGYKDVAVLSLFLGYVSTFVIYWMALLK
jgi:ATP synthase protein I